MKNKYIYWTVAISNVALLAAFTALAIIFHKWWIVLFSLLCYSYKSKTVQKHYRICDKCGRHGPEKGTYNDALDAAKEAGWYSEPIKLSDGSVNMIDYCPQCQEKMKQELSDLLKG